MKPSRWWSGILYVTAIAAGCGDGSTDGSTRTNCDGGCTQLKPADQAFIKSLCSLMADCCVRNGRRTEPDLEGCISAMGKAGPSGDSSLRQACLAELQSLHSSMSCLPELWQGSDACARVLWEPSGSSQPGQPCVTNGDCAGAPGKFTLCSTDPSGASPTGNLCLQLAPGQPGDRTCLGDMDEDGGIIAAAFYFARAGGPPIANGVVCRRRDGVYCAFTEDPGTTACAALGAAGSSCRYGKTCASGLCSGGEGNAGTCVAQVGAGHDCGWAAACDGTSFCKNDGTTSTPICSPKRAPGADCHYSDDAACTTGYCDHDTYTCSALTHAEMTSQTMLCIGLL